MENFNHNLGGISVPDKMEARCKKCKKSIEGIFHGMSWDGSGFKLTYQYDYEDKDYPIEPICEKCFKINQIKE